MIYEGAQTLLGVSFMAFTVNTFISMEERTQVQVIATYINMVPTFLGGMIPIWFLTGEYSRMDLIVVFSGAILLGMALVWIGSRFIRENGEFYKNIQATRNLKELFVLSKDLFKDKTFTIFMASFFLISCCHGELFLRLYLLHGQRAGSLWIEGHASGFDQWIGADGDFPVHCDHGQEIRLQRYSLAGASACGGGACRPDPADQLLGYHRDLCCYHAGLWFCLGD